MKSTIKNFGFSALTTMVCALVLGVFLVAGQTSMGATPIKIGYVGGISGGCGGLTHSVIKAMKIATKEINDAGGVLGRPFKVIYRDSKTKPDEGAKQARDLILSEKVEILVGTCSSSIFMAINPISKQYKIRIDREKLEVEHREVTGRELLGLVGKNPEAHRLHQKLHGGQVVCIGADEIVDLGKPGLERFMTLLCRLNRSDNSRILGRPETPVWVCTMGIGSFSFSFLSCTIS